MNSTITKTVAALAVASMAFFAFAQAKKPQAFFCKYCGQKASNIVSPMSVACILHPNGPHKGKHEPAL